MGSEDSEAGSEDAASVEPVQFPDPDPSDLIGAVSFDGLSPTDFEDFCFDLVCAAGFTNVD
jgi:hypothetical protein